jgi:hypothetical protein
LYGWPTVTEQDSYGSVIVAVQNDDPASQFPVSGSYKSAASTPLHLSIGQSVTVYFGFTDALPNCDNISTLAFQFERNGSTLSVPLGEPWMACNAGEISFSPYLS